MIHSPIHLNSCHKIKTTIVFILMMAVFTQSNAAQLRIAVASNFLLTLNELKTAFKAHKGHDILISSASSGQLYAQIKQAAPYDVFMSADMSRPQQLLADGLASQLITYAQGQLVMLTNGKIDDSCPSLEEHEGINYLAMANPDLAPYGFAAKAYLMQHHNWGDYANKLVLGENVSQAMQMVASGNASVGLVALSLLENYELQEHQCVWKVPVEKYPHIWQGMVFIKGSGQELLYQEWRDFLASPVARQIIVSHGYINTQES